MKCCTGKYIGSEGSSPLFFLFLLFCLFSSPPTIIKVNWPHTSKMTQEIPTITTTERKRDHFPTVDEAYFCVHNKSRYKSDLLVAVALHLGGGRGLVFSSPDFRATWSVPHYKLLVKRWWWWMLVVQWWIIEAILSFLLFLLPIHQPVE